MKRIKKIFAFALAMVMMLAMNVTVFAARTTTVAADATITVKGLTASEETTVKVYNVVYFDEENSKWTLSNLATDALVSEENAQVNDFTKEDYAKVAAYVTSNSVEADYTQVAQVNDTDVEFSNLMAGAYLVLATGTETEYNVMGVVTYDYDDNNLLVTIDAEINAKGSTYTVSKALNENSKDDDVVAFGDEVVFDITTTFPSFGMDETNPTFSITDSPVGLKITSVSVTLAGTELEEGEDKDYTVTELGKADTDVTVSFTSDFIGEEDAHAGAQVIVTVTATVTSDKGYVNTANTSKAKQESEKVVGYTGSITINKYNENGVHEDNFLDGASFGIYKDGTKLGFTKNDDGTYTYDATNADGTDLLADGGSVTVYGLDTGVYTFVEEQAPAGYSIVDIVEKVTIDVDDADNVDKVIEYTVDVIDTKLSALPSTGGIGTTIFTIAGVAIMVLAAGLFFVSRRKNAR